MEMHNYTKLAILYNPNYHYYYF